MRKIITFAGLCLMCACAANQRSGRDNTSFVNVFTGTGTHGHTFPGATRPFSMVQLSPDTHLIGWDASSGYHYADSVIYSFSHTHLSGTGIGDLGDVALLPYVGSDTLQIPVATFSHERESASPGYYRVMLDNFGVEVELTSTERVGISRYTYPKDSTRRVMLDLAHILQPNWGHKVVSNTVTVLSKTEVEGTLVTTGWAYDHRINYHIVFSEPATNVILRDSGLVVNVAQGAPFTSAGQVRLYFEFPPSAKPLSVKTALSPVDTEGAGKNLAAELPGWDFDKVKERSHEIWRDALSVVEAESSDSTVLQTFYSALYHTMIAPVLWQDTDGRYRGMDKKIHTAPAGYTNYTVFSMWDTFRAWHPMMTLLKPDKAAEWGQVLVQIYREGDILPKWPLVSNYTGCMVAYPAVSVLADLQSKRLLKDDSMLVAQAALRSSIYRADLAAKFAGTRESDLITKHVYYKDRYGFVPADSIPESVSWGVEMAYDDWCVAQLARKAGDNDSYNAYMRKSDYWRRYYDPETGMMRGVMGDGRFRSPFNPFYSSHMQSDYTEGNAFQWSYFVPHDMPGFIAAHGGPGGLEAALDGLFSAPSQIDGENASGDITGLIGQYAHGNEPSHHIAYLYNWTEAPWKAQAMLDTIMRTFYSPTPEGIAGNEDVGQMSAWYVLSAMGFYQVCPGDPTWTIGRPMLDYASIKVPGGKFEIVVHNNSAQNKYIAQVVLNGSPLAQPFFKHSDFKAGGKLEFTMTDHHRSVPPLRFDSKVWTLGEILEADGKVMHKFLFENTGSQPIVIEDVTATCGCTIPEASRKPVPPAGKGEITVTFNPEHRSGPFSANVYVNTSEGRLVLSLAGKVTSRTPTIEERYPLQAAGGVRLSDNEIIIGRVAQGQIKTMKVGVINTSSEAVRISLVSPHPYVKITAPTELAPGAADGIAVTYDLRTAAAYGVVEDRLVVSVGGKPTPAAITAKAILTDNFETVDRSKAPAALYSCGYEELGDHRKGEPLSKEVTVENKGKSDLLIRSIQTNDKATTTLRAGQVVKPGQSLKFTVVLDTKTSGVVTGLVTIVENDPSLSVHEVRLRVNVK